MNVLTQLQRPYLGFGLGLRPTHYEAILTDRPNLDWFEIITENYLVPGGKPLHYLDRVRELYPLVMHGVSLSIGSADGIDLSYLKEVKELIDRVQPKWVSDHLCWTGVDHLNMHDLLPLPYTLQTAKYVADNIKKVQDYLGRQILIENVSSYLTYQQSEMTEWEFISEIVKQADCFILLDVNNIYVSAFNHEFEPLDYVKGVPGERVHQIHLAGHSNNGDHIIDTHDAPVIQPVWDLYAETLKHLGPVSTMIERDANIPELQELLDEINHARAIAGQLFKVEGKEYARA